MARFEESSRHHEVHEIHRPQGHGYVDQKYGKGNLSPIHGSVPTTDSGSVPGDNGVGAPGTPAGIGGTSGTGY